MAGVGAADYVIAEGLVDANATTKTEQTVITKAMEKPTEQNEQAVNTKIFCFR